MGCSSSVATLQPQKDDFKDDEHGKEHQHLTDEHCKEVQQQSDPPQAPILDPVQRQYITETWLKLDPGIAHIGKQSLLRMFEEEPLIKKTFDLAEYWGDDLLNNPVFQTQTDRFGKTIGYIVDNIENLCTDGAKCSFGAGVYHAGRSGVSVHFFDALVKPLLLVWQSELKADFTPAVRDAWRTLFLYMVQKMKEGFTSATKDNDVDNQT